MVICTLLSAPMMFMSAQLITISKDYAAQIKRFGYGTSIAALVAIIWVFLVFLLTKKYKRMPHRLTLCLLASQVSSFLHDCDEAKKKGYDRKFGCFFPTFQVRSWFEILCKVLITTYHISPNSSHPSGASSGRGHPPCFTEALVKKRECLQLKYYYVRVIILFKYTEKKSSVKWLSHTILSNIRSKKHPNFRSLVMILTGRHVCMYVGTSVTSYITSICAHEVFNRYSFERTDTIFLLTKIIVFCS